MPRSGCVAKRPTDPGRWHLEYGIADRIAACKEAPVCAPAKHHFDECTERVTKATADGSAPTEDCVEECTSWTPYPPALATLPPHPPRFFKKGRTGGRGRCPLEKKSTVD
ncbi:hypothetical protein IMZ48_48820 [Candidatus Bathyarchaeota archaeon]|nr:hypothetical protein [Candidatus Bathyarchaeota archaeon]